MIVLAARLPPPVLAALFAAALCPVFAADLADANVLAATENTWLTSAEIDTLPEGLPQYSGSVPKTPAHYNVGAVKGAMRELSRFLAENGYPYNRITVSIANDDSAAADDGWTALAVRFVVEPDEKVCNGAPMIVGAGGRTDIYFKDMRIVPGSPYSAADVDETVRRLQTRPYIRNAEAGSPVIIEDAPRSHCGQGETGDSSNCCDSASPAKTLLRTAVTPITVIENRGMVVEGVLGYESGSKAGSGPLSGRVDLAFVNMLRNGETADVSYTGTSIMQRFKFTGAWPWIFAMPLEAGGSLGLEIEDGGYGFFSGELWGALEVNARWKGGIAVKASETVPGGDTAAKAGDPYVFYGVDVFAMLIRERNERGKTVWELSGRTGSGTANREKSYIRNKMELTAGIHKPIANGYALAGRVCAKALFTDEEYLPPAETYRTGGHGSLRGYSEEEFAFRTAAYLQMEALYYFNKIGALYIFVDGGTGWSLPGSLSLSSAKKMIGYGTGIRFPSRVGDVSIEWARNGSDGWSLGRVHAGIRIGVNP